MSEPAQLLLQWFSTQQRPLPWRTAFPRDPYLVLLSEVMLQQTQVERVVPSYLLFLKRFPNITALAAASEDEVLAAWSGLGYYRRARALHAAARAIVAAGSWPSSFEQLRRLPGFGPYTAAAVAAFCFAGDHPPVDGNVARIAARVLALDAPLGSAQLARGAEPWAQDLHRSAPTPQVFEALMELGARVCRPVSPACQRCPLAAGCAARAAGAPERYPAPRPRRPRQAHRWVALWLQRPDGRVLLQRRALGHLLGGLWLPPLVELTNDQQPAPAAVQLLHQLGYSASLRPAAPVNHSITHRDITVFPFAGHCQPFQVSEVRGVVWTDPLATELATSTLTHKLRLACQGLLGE